MQSPIMDRLPIDGGGRHGFTLVELLVVVAIISILAAMLMPALGNALSQGRRIQCLNTQKQYFLGVSLYADEANNWYPYHKQYPDAFWVDTGSISTQNLLFSYLGIRKRLNCPEYHTGSGDPHYFLIGGTVGNPYCAPTYREYKHLFSPSYWNEAVIYTEYRFPCITDANLGDISTGIYTQSNHGKGQTGITGANAISFDGSGKWVSMNPLSYHYWYNPSNSAATWGSYGNLIYPIPANPPR